MFSLHEPKIGTKGLSKGLTSNEVLTILRDNLLRLGFQVEAGRQKENKSNGPCSSVRTGEPPSITRSTPITRSGDAASRLKPDVRGWGTGCYRDLIQGLVMVQVDTLVLAVPNGYRYQSGGRSAVSADYDNTVSVAETLYGHSRIRMPYGLVVIGY